MGPAATVVASPLTPQRRAHAPGAHSPRYSSLTLHPGNTYTSAPGDAIAPSPWQDAGGTPPPPLALTRPLLVCHRYRHSERHGDASPRRKENTEDKYRQRSSRKLSSQRADHVVRHHTAGGSDGARSASRWPLPSPDNEDGESAPPEHNAASRTAARCVNKHAPNPSRSPRRCASPSGSAHATMCSRPPPVSRTCESHAAAASCFFARVARFSAGFLSPLPPSLD